MSSTTTTSRASRFQRALTLGAMLLALGCSDDESTAPTPIVAQVVVSPAVGTLMVGDELAYTARALDARGIDIDGGNVTWTSTNEAVATVSTAGRVTALGAGNTSIRATIGGKSGVATLDVSLAPVARVDLSLPEAILAEGDTQMIEATAKDAAGRVLLGRGVAWTTSDPSIAAVSTTGLVSAVAPGSARIRATVEGAFAESIVTVRLAPVDRVELSHDAVTIAEHESATLAAVLKDAGGRVLTGRAVTWSSSDPAIATVDASGRITAVREGRAAMTARAEGRSAGAMITVTRAAIASITISPSAVVLEIGEARQLQAVVKDAKGNLLQGRTVQWSVDNTNATVSPSGILTGVRNGYLTVQVAGEGVSAATGGTIVTGERPAYDLVYHRLGTSGASELFVLPLGTTTAPLKINAGNVSRSPTPSPDGSRVAFAVSMELPLTGQRVDDIFAVDRSGLNMKQLTNAPGFDDSPDWSPTGGRIVYRHWEAEGRSDIWIVNADGSAATNLTADMPASAHRREPKWSRDGMRIAFSQFEHGPDGTTASIWTMRADGTDRRQLTSTLSGFDTSPTWSPDGRHIAFTRYYAGESDLTLVNTVTGALSRLPLPGLEQAPAWSPDGAYIAFSHTASGNIYTIQPDGTRLRLRTVDPAWGGGLAPAWILRR